MNVQEAYTHFVSHANDKGSWEPSYQGFFEAGYRAGKEQLQQMVEAFIYIADEDGWTACRKCWATPGLPHDENCDYFELAKALDG